MSGDSGDSGMGDLGGNDYDTIHSPDPPSAYSPPPGPPAPTGPAPSAPPTDEWPGNEPPPEDGGGLNLGLPVSIPGGLDGDVGDLPGLAVDAGTSGGASVTGLDVGGLLPAGDGEAGSTSLAGLAGGDGDGLLGLVGAAASVDAGAGDDAGLVDVDVDAGSSSDDGGTVLVRAETTPGDPDALFIDVLETDDGGDGSLVTVGDGAADADGQLLSVSNDGDTIVAVDGEQADTLLTVDTGSDDTGSIIADLLQTDGDATVSAGTDDGNTSLLVDAADVTADATQDGAQSDLSVDVSGPAEASALTGIDTLDLLLLQ